MQVWMCAGLDEQFETVTWHRHAPLVWLLQRCLSTRQGDVRVRYPATNGYCTLLMALW